MPELVSESTVATALLNNLGQCCRHVPQVGNTHSAWQGTPLGQSRHQAGHTPTLCHQTLL